MKIIKRNGNEVEFDITKIENAIRKASAEVETQHQLSEDDVVYIARQVAKVCEEHNRAMNVEEIQDIVESKLIQYNYADVARCYIKYRFTRELVRKGNSTDESILAIINNTNEEVKQENSNKNPTVNSVQRDYMAGEVSKDLTRRILLPPDVVRAHDAGILHFHDADYFSQRMHNCFTGATKFITDKGIREFKSFNDGDSVVVKDKDGVLRRAKVRMYGKQKMQVVTLKNPKKTVQFICTPNHRWVLKDGTVTTKLTVGDVLYATQDSTQYTIETPEEAEAFTAGFVVGDGTDCSNDATRVRLCGDKKQYAPYFIMAGYTVTEPEQMDGDMVAYRYRKQKQNFLNGKAWRFMPANLQALAFHGYYAADGAKGAHKACTADERVALFIQETCGLAGYYLSSVVEEVRDTQFKTDSKLYAHHFMVSHPDNWRWRVTDIEPYGHGEVNAWCVEEPVTHTFTLEHGIVTVACNDTMFQRERVGYRFTLEHGIVTGNCDLVNLEDMLQNGTVISGTMIEKPHSFSTACNIATQVIAQVASNQYGKAN